VTALEGRCDPAFRGVADVLADSFARGEQLGAAVAVYAGGRPVVDLWAGVADPRQERPWDEGTVAMGFSVTKAAVGALCCRLAQEGLVDLDEPLVRRWPELTRGGGKEAVTLRWVLSHRAGLPALRRPLEPLDLVAGQPALDALADEEPWWEPGTAAGYHPLTFGFLVGEALRRALGATTGELLARHVAGPLGLELWVGLPDEVRPRLARLEEAEDDSGDDTGDGGAVDGHPAMPPGSLAEAAFANPPMAVAAWNSAALLRAELPAVNGVGTARSWARLLAACCGPVDGVALLDPAWRDAARTTEYRGPDLVQDGVELHVGLGVRLPTAAQPLLGPGSFGHTGTGGAVVAALPEAQLAVAFLPNRLHTGAAEDRCRGRLLEAARAAC